MLVHTVLFYLRPDLTAAQREEFLREGLEPLRGIPAVKSALIGRPAAVTPRPVVDLSFDYALTATFDDVAGHDAYQTHPLHTGFVTRFKPCWTRVQIYDAE